MKYVLLLGSLAALSGLSLSCTAFPAGLGEEVMQVPTDGRIEVGLSPRGGVAEVELHVPPSLLPARIREAAARHLATVTAAEIEFIGGARLYEAAGRAPDGRELEVLLHEDGSVAELEIGRREEEMPAPVVTTAKEWRGAGAVTSWEEIQDAAGRTLAWHVKKTVEGLRFKLVFRADGRLQRVYRETPAEIEVVVG